MGVVGGGEGFVQMLVGDVFEGLDVDAVIVDGVEKFSDRGLRLWCCGILWILGVSEQGSAIRDVTVRVFERGRF